MNVDHDKQQKFFFFIVICMSNRSIECHFKLFLVRTELRVFCGSESLFNHSFKFHAIQRLNGFSFILFFLFWAVTVSVSVLYRRRLRMKIRKKHPIC